MTDGERRGRGIMAAKPPGFFEGTEMPTAGWWEALWRDPAGVLASEAAGFRLAALVDIPPYHYAAVFERPAE